MKKVKTHKDHSIYQANTKEQCDSAGEYNVFLPDESPFEFFTPEFECDSINDHLRIRPSHRRRPRRVPVWDADFLHRLLYPHKKQL